MTCHTLIEEKLFFLKFISWFTLLKGQCVARNCFPAIFHAFFGSRFTLCLTLSFAKLLNKILYLLHDQEGELESK